jgi:serine phosphatase RsbU (regulator of sigma subunit)
MGKVERIKAGGLALGLVADQSPYFQKRELKTSPGDVVLLYTDGIIDARTKHEVRDVLAQPASIRR